MSNTAVVLDTNIIILHITGKEPVHFLKNIPIISTLTVFELLQYAQLTKREEESIHDIIGACVVVPITQAIAERAAQLARRKKMGVVDVLIAATALEFDAPLQTKNTKDFRHITELQLLG
jgi:predicted nucleic acid-binding protein